MKTFFILLLSLVITGCATPVYRAGDTTVTKILVEEKNPRPSVILIHGCGGTAPHEHWMNILNKHGFNTVLIDFINPRGYSSICDLNVPISINETINDINQIIGWVQTQPWHKDRVSAMGFSFGGSIVNTFTDLDNLKAKQISTSNISRLYKVVSVYPLCSIGGLAEKSKIPTQVHFGLNDYWTHHSVCMTDRLDKSNYELIYYKDAMHGFDIPNTPTHVNGVYRLKFNPTAFQEMQENVVKFLR